MWLNGPIDSVTGATETFVKERMHTLTGKVEPVGIDDASLFLARFANGSLATFEGLDLFQCPCCRISWVRAQALLLLLVEFS